MHVFAHDRCQANLSVGWLVCGCIFKFSHEVMSIGGYILGKNKLNGPASLPITASYPLPPTRNRFWPKKDSRLRKDGGQNCASLHWIAYILDRRQLTLSHEATFQIGRQFRFPWQPAENGWLEIGLYCIKVGLQGWKCDKVAWCAKTNTVTCEFFSLIPSIVHKLSWDKKLQKL